ncbi:MAG: lysophospholipid acyltransferase family protein [Kiritimatiellia bacterium]
MYLIYRLAQIIVRRLPHPMAYYAGMRLADVFFVLDRRGRRAVIANLSRILKHQGRTVTQRELTRMCRRNFENFGKYLVDFFRFARFQPDQIGQLVQIENMEALEQARAHNKGVILVTAHFGNWELGGAVLTTLGYELSAVFQPERARSVNRLFQQRRAGRGIHGIELGKAARSVIKVLKNKGMAAMLADRDFSGERATIDFFGAPAHLPSGPARMAQRTGAPVVPMFMSHKPDDTFVLRAYPPIIPTANTTVEDIHRQIRDALEHAINQNPLQWFIFEDFWRDRHE